MQKIILTEQESDQSRSSISVKNPVGTLVFGLFLALLLMIFDRRHQTQLLDAQPGQTGGWGRTLVVLFFCGLALFVLVNLIMGP